MKFMEWEEITREDGRPYLRRLILFKCKLFGIFIHWFLGSDDACSHDHPWSFLTLILKGGYYEEAYDKTRCLSRKWYSPGSLLFRPAKWTHRVDIDLKCPAVTLFMHGPKEKHWGFWTKYGFIHWSKYSHKEHCA